MNEKQKAQLQWLRDNDKAVFHHNGQVAITIKCWDCDAGESSAPGCNRQPVYEFFNKHAGHDTSVGKKGFIEDWEG